MVVVVGGGMLWLSLFTIFSWKMQPGSFFFFLLYEQIIFPFQKTCQDKNMNKCHDQFDQFKN